MKYIKNLILTVSGIAVAMGVSSCNSFLDMTPTDSVSDKMLWENHRECGIWSELHL